MSTSQDGMPALEKWCRAESPSNHVKIVESYGARALASTNVLEGLETISVEFI